MNALGWHGGSDLHLYKMLGAFLDKGDVLGHEPVGEVEEFKVVLQP